MLMLMLTESAVFKLGLSTSSNYLTQYGYSMAAVIYILLFTIVKDDDPINEVPKFRTFTSVATPGCYRHV